jgi:hypothetical protein
MQFIVNNQLPFGTTVHFHGIEYDTISVGFQVSLLTFADN